MWGVSCVIVLLSVACVAAGDGDSDHPCLRLSPANTDFAFNLFRRLGSKPHAKNVVLSPMTVSMALSILSLGSRGETHSQLFSTLGYSSLTQDKVNKAYECILRLAGYAKDTIQLDMGYTLALRDDFEPLNKFLEDAKEYYTSEVVSVNFNITAQAEAKLNQFIATKTHDKITDLVKGLSPDMVMVLTNYVIFRGNWVTPFDAKMTTKANFQVDKNTLVEVDMMRRTGHFDFYQDHDNHATVVMLHYKGNVSMMIILPDEGKMEEVEGNLNKDNVKHWQYSVFSSSLNLIMPKLSIAASTSLGNILKDMGMVAAFGDAADFSGISGEPKLKVSKVEHETVLTVDETGTEAAPATTKIMPVSVPQTMNVNRPFLLLIMGRITNTIYFLGKVCDPTAK